ncbi:mechanosensitive ion channel family protein [Pseudodesulfovibrio sp.]|uniref:mechanosensitive ion channel family protein n=1 Tax=unclassified Pseudodesulfovibrio TaxID=2661612 RepID=UPI003B00DA7E
MEQRLADAYAFLLNWVQTNVLTWSTAAQWVCVAVGYVLTAFLWRGYERRLLERVDAKGMNSVVRAIARSVVDVGNVVGFVLVLRACAAVFADMDLKPGVLDAASDLAVAWIIIRLITSVMPNRTLARGVVTLVWVVAALSVFGLLAPITGFLNDLRFSIGQTAFTALGMIKGVVLAVIFLQAASLAVQFVNRRITSASGLSPSLQVLLAKGFKLILYTGAVLVAMSWVGIDLTSLAIFSSALGVGIGFGLKTIFSNYVAGILLLMDNSIKPGDTIEVAGVFGVVHDMHGRYTSILARNGKEYLIPNEQLITGEVVNWTYSDRNIRLSVPVGIAYESDLDKAMALLPEAAKSVPRVLSNPSPAPRLIEFGDSSVNLELRFWIADAEDGLTNVESDVLVRIWHLFHENGIAFPFPQRDVLLKQDSALTVKLDKESDAD